MIEWKQIKSVPFISDISGRGFTSVGTEKEHFNYSTNDATWIRVQVVRYVKWN